MCGTFKEEKIVFVSVQSKEELWISTLHHNRKSKGFVLPKSIIFKETFYWEPSFVQ